MSTTTTEISATIDCYVAAWNETDPVRRRGLIEDAWADDATYLDPMLAGESHGGIDAMIAAAQEQFAGYEVRLTGPIDRHHDRVRFTWEIGDLAGGEPSVAGIDFGVIGSDGRLRSITGFFDRYPE